MKTAIFATAFAIASLSTVTSVSAQVTANVSLNNNQQILDTGLLQRLQCQRNPRACTNNAGSQRAQAGNRRGNQQGGGPRP